MAEVDSDQPASVEPQVVKANRNEVGAIERLAHEPSEISSGRESSARLDI